jgi:Ca2+-binding EF-hand superfamily protein
MATRKGVPNTQFVFGVLGDICDALQKKKYNIGQLLSAMDVNKTGYNSRAEFTNIVNQMAENVPLESVRKVVSFLDHTGTGKVSIVEFLRLCQELLN